MPRRAKELSAVEVKRLAGVVGFHAVGGVPGLYLQATSPAAVSWILYTKVGDDRPMIGLGGYPALGLKDARDKARATRELIEQGVDPRDSKREAKAALKLAQAKRLTFRECAEQKIAAEAGAWRNGKHRAQWESTLTEFAYPLIGSLPVSEVTTDHVLAVLRPIWTEKTETASRLRGRIEVILSWASAQGLRNGDNPARWRGHLDQLLAKPRSLAPRQHHRALAIAAMPGFMAKLAKVEGASAAALGFAVLTAARSGEARGARWSEIDQRTGLWTIPAERMKAKRPHVVPLSKQALALLKAQTRMVGVDFVFPSAAGKMLSDMALTMTMRRLGETAVPHGMRSVFRSWCAEQNESRELAEQALAHVIESQTERAYQRSDQLELRRALMQRWAAFATSKPAAKVVALKRKA